MVCCVPYEWYSVPSLYSAMGISSVFGSCVSPMLILPPFRPFMAMLNPCPSSPSRLLTGTAQSSKITALVGWEFQPTWRTHGDRRFLPSSGYLLALQTADSNPKPTGSTFFSFLPKLRPGAPFSTTRQEMPFGPLAPVRHITTYRSVSPPPLMKAWKVMRVEKRSVAHCCLS